MTCGGFPWKFVSFVLEQPLLLVPFVTYIKKQTNKENSQRFTEYRGFDVLWYYQSSQNHSEEAIFSFVGINHICIIKVDIQYQKSAASLFLMSEYFPWLFWGENPAQLLFH